MNYGHTLLDKNYQSSSVQLLLENPILRDAGVVTLATALKYNTSLVRLAMKVHNITMLA